MSVDDTSSQFSRSQPLTMGGNATEGSTSQSPIQAEIVNPESVNAGRCLNPLCGKPLETKSKAIWRKTSCDDRCRNTLSAFRRVACALFPELEPARAIETLLSRVEVKTEATAKNDSAVDIAKEANDG